jgi:hypothetical protein
LQEKKLFPAKTQRRKGLKKISKMEALENIPENLSALLEAMTRDFPVLLEGNLVGLYLWGSLTYAAFDETCSDVDAIVVTRRALDEQEFSALENWFDQFLEKNPWTARLDMRFVIDREFLDKTSVCCGYHFGKLVRHGSDGNPFIWLNIGRSGITLWGKPAAEIAPEVPKKVLDEALLLELRYLREDLASNAGDISDLSFFHNSYAVLTACRIFYTARNHALVSKDTAAAWALRNLPEKWREIIKTAQANRLTGRGVKTAELESDAIEFVDFIERRVKNS